MTHENESNSKASKRIDENRMLREMLSTERRMIVLIADISKKLRTALLEGGIDRFDEEAKRLATTDLAKDFMRRVDSAMTKKPTSRKS